MLGPEGFVRQVCVNCGYVSPFMNPRSASVEMNMCIRCWSFGARLEESIMFTDHNAKDVMESESSEDEADTSESES